MPKADLNLARRPAVEAHTDIAPEAHVEPTPTTDIAAQLESTPVTEIDPLVWGPFGKPSFGQCKASPYKGDNGEVTTNLAKVIIPLLGAPGMILTATLKQRSSEITVGGQKRFNRETYLAMPNLGRGTGFAAAIDATLASTQSAYDEWLYMVATAGEAWYVEANGAQAIATAQVSDRRRVVKMYDADGKLVASA